MYQEFLSFIPLEDFLPWLENKKLVTLEVLGGLLETDFVVEEGFLSYLELWTGMEELAFEREFASQTAPLLSASPKPPALKHLYTGLPIDPAHELDLLRATTTPIQHARRLYDACVERGIEIVALCDSPYSSAFIQELLIQHGFEDVREVMVSCETGKTKKSYQAFRDLLQERNLEPAEVLHFGGDAYSDYGVPRDIGMDTLLIVPDWQGLSRRHIEFKEIFECLVPRAAGTNSITDMLLPMIMARTASSLMAERGWPEALPPGLIDGLRTLGPVLGGFICWLHLRLSQSPPQYLLLMGAAPESALARLLQESLQHLLQETSIVPLLASDTETLPAALREVPLQQLAIVNLDPTGAAVGRLVAHVPPVAAHAVYHLLLEEGARKSPHDLAYLSCHGLPKETQPVLQKLNGYWDILRQPDDIPEHCAEARCAAHLFLQHFLTFFSRYGKLHITRKAIMALHAETTN